MQDHRFELVDPNRELSPTRPEVFDRVAFAASALRLLRPPRTTVAICRSTRGLRVETARDLSRGTDAVFTILAIPEWAGRAEIAQAVAEIAGLGGAPLVVAALLGHTPRAHH